MDTVRYGMRGGTQGRSGQGRPLADHHDAGSNSKFGRRERTGAMRSEWYPPRAESWLAASGRKLGPLGRPRRGLLADGLYLRAVLSMAS